jgi:hypothetical protein
MRCSPSIKCRPIIDKHHIFQKEYEGKSNQGFKLKW